MIELAGVCIGLLLQAQHRYAADDKHDTDAAKKIHVLAQQEHRKDRHPDISQRDDWKQARQLAALERKSHQEGHHAVQQVSAKELEICDDADTEAEKESGVASHVAERDVPGPKLRSSFFHQYLGSGADQGAQENQQKRMPRSSPCIDGGLKDSRRTQVADSSRKG